MLTQDYALAAHIDRLLAGFESTNRTARAANTFQVVTLEDGGYRLYRDCSRITQSVPSDQIFSPLIGSLNLRALDRCDDFAVHAAVVARGQRVLAMPADTGGGKTTLAASCLRAGFAYLSDEALVLDDDGVVVPYPKPLALTPWSCQVLGLEPDGRERLMTAKEMGSAVHPGGNPLTDVVIAEYGFGGAGLEPAPRSEAVTAFLSRSFNHYKAPERAFRLTTDVARTVSVWRLRYGDPLEAAQLLRDRLG